MKKQHCIGMILTLALAACGQPAVLPAQAPPTAVLAPQAPSATSAPAPTPIIPTTTPVAATYQGLALPTPLPANADDLQPPPAWLIVGGSAVLATGGNTSITRKSDGAVQHADALAPQQSRALATAALPAADTSAIIVIGSRSITTFQARVQPWAAKTAAIFFDPSSGRPLKAEKRRDGDLTVFTLEPIGAAADQILAVSISFDDSYSSGDASYVWRLNPVQATAVVVEAESIGQGRAIRGSIEATVMPAGVIDLAPPITSPTPLRGPTTITLNHMQMGQTLYLSVGDTFTLDSLIPQPIHLRDERIVAPVPGAQGVYKAFAAGQTALEVTVDPCAGWNQPTACTQPLGSPLILIIVVQ